jgi:hypothetical protein
MRDSKELSMEGLSPSDSHHYFSVLLLGVTGLDHCAVRQGKVIDVEQKLSCGGVVVVALLLRMGGALRRGSGAHCDQYQVCTHLHLDGLGAAFSREFALTEMRKEWYVYTLWRTVKIFGIGSRIILG